MHELPERLRNAGIEPYDPANKTKRKIILSDAKIDVLAEVMANLLKEEGA